MNILNKIKKKKKKIIKKSNGSKKLGQEPRLKGENFRQWAERIGVSPDKVKDFKYKLLKEKNK